LFNIMLLEDQPAVRDIVTEVLGMVDVPIHIGAAGNLTEARQLLEERSWHGMISDLSLPDGQSLDLIAEMREQEIVIPTILVSGMLSPEKEHRARSLGIDKILAKPFRPDDLLAYVNKIIADTQGATDNKQEPSPQNPKFSGELLSGVFSMDRNLDFMRRLVRDIPSSGGVIDICADTLTLAVDMLHADGGFMAFFDRSKNKLSLVTSQHGSNEELAQECALDCTPFPPLLEDNEMFLHIRGENGEKNLKELWPGFGVGPAIAIPICLQQQSVGVLCLISNHWQDTSITDQDRLTMQDILIPQLDTLLDNQAVHAALKDSVKETLFALVRLLEARDRYTRYHSTRVSRLATDLAVRLGLNDETVDIIRTGGLLHDIGKIAVADAVLMKPGRLTEHEFAMVKAHTTIGDTMLGHLDSLVSERQIVRSHHEYWDGSGYPDGLKGEEIPLPARVVGVADALDAMTSHLCYRMALPLSVCREQLVQCSGTQFDPAIAAIAIDVIDEGKIQTQAGSIMKKEADISEK